MQAPFSILALDLHNTIYDELMEYGPAIDAAANVWMTAAKGAGHTLEKETVFKDLSHAHRMLGSDWDKDAWRHMPCLTRLAWGEAEFEKILREAEASRAEKSKALTVNGCYGDMWNTLSHLKKSGIRIYLVTEASASAALNAVRWLKLEGIIAGIHSYPSRHALEPMDGTYHRVFPQNDAGIYLIKPHPFIIAAVVLDEAKHRKCVPATLVISDVFTTARQDNLVIPEIAASEFFTEQIGSKLLIRDTPYAEIVQNILDAMLYVGDSKFKDGLLAKNSGIAFGYAAYGKCMKPGTEKAYEENLSTMYSVTGWDKNIMKLTQQAGSSPTIHNLEPTYTFEHGLTAVLPLFES